MVVVIIVKVRGKPWEVTGMFMALMVVVVSQVYPYPQTHQMVYIKYVQLFICPSYSNTVFFKKKKNGAHTFQG